MDAEHEAPKCSTCGKELLPEDMDKKWRKCHFCGKPICFDHTHYLGVRLPGLYRDYLDVVGVCKKCMPKGY